MSFTEQNAAAVGAAQGSSVVRDVIVGAAVAVVSVALTLAVVSASHHNETAATVSAPPPRPASTSSTHTDECPGSDSALMRAPGPPDDPYQVVGPNWPQGDSCQLLEEMLAVDNAEAGFPTWQLPAALKNARWAADELVRHAGGLLGVTIPDDMGVSTETVERALIEASRAIRDAKERITGIVATVNATMHPGDANSSTASLLLGGHRERIAAERKQLDAKLRKIGSAVRDHLIPGGEPAQQTYLVWNEQGVTNVVDRQGYALDSDTNARMSDVPFVTLPPVEPVKQPSPQGRT
ncbi:hypothetical protein [Mycobacterium sp.]|uniref:hypothetical protein n=1 Tax=Mycobacterium sp. TaxID=1785 RepID=UPI00128772C1|nr:hypothetical protein [Mycobacterium sp.]KAA8969780.1 MAG: hypothetical protein F6Q13_01550 [Mycobacterium sp.]